MAEYTDPFHAPVWDSTDAEKLREFLTTQTGRRVIARLRSERPAYTALALVPPGRDLVQLRAIEGATRDGYEQAINAIFEFLTEEVAEAVQSRQYPSIDDEAAWPAHLRATPPNEAEGEMRTEAPDLPDPKAIQIHRAKGDLLEVIPPPVVENTSPEPVPSVTIPSLPTV